MRRDKARTGSTPQSRAYAWRTLALAPRGRLSWKRGCLNDRLADRTALWPLCAVFGCTSFFLHLVRPPENATRPSVRIACGGGPTLVALTDPWPSPRCLAFVSMFFARWPTYRCGPRADAPDADSGAMRASLSRKRIAICSRRAPLLSWPLAWCAARAVALNMIRFDRVGSGQQSLRTLPTHSSPRYNPFPSQSVSPHPDPHCHSLTPPNPERTPLAHCRTLHVPPR